MDGSLDFETLAKDTVRILDVPQATFKRPLAIIMVGFPTAGKTTLATKLKERLPLTLLTEENLTSFLAPRATVVKRNAIEVFQLAAKTIENLIKMGKPCIYDSNVKAKEQRDLLKKIVEDGGGSFLLIYIQCPKDTCYRRLEKHNLQVSRGEVKGFILDKDTFEYEASTTRLPPPEENHVAIRCDDPESIAHVFSIADSRLKENN